jgi:hypothetical protein
MDSGNSLNTWFVMLLLLAGTALACLISFIACRWLLHKLQPTKVPRSVLCALLWMVAASPLALAAWLLVLRGSDAMDLMGYVAAMGIAGLVYGAVYPAMHRRFKLVGSWWHRALVGAGLGVAVVGVVLVVLLLSSGIAGTPFDNSRSSHGYFLLALFFVSGWIPLLAVAGALTPLGALLCSPQAQDLA